MADAQGVRVLNAKTSWYDPPKDLDISFPGGGKLSNTTHRARITACMKRLFEVTIGTTRIDEKLPNWAAVGTRSNKILESLGQVYGTRLENLSHVDIIREKHSSGHSSRPSELNVMQDCGPVDVVANPILTITPGSVIDPAGKTKVNANNLINNAAAGDPVLILDMSYIRQLALETCITDNVIVSIDGAYYKVIIPTILTTINGGRITAYFSKTTFLPDIGRGNSEYFQGNPVKNENINTLIDSGNTVEINDQICAYILMKELGDTLQVIWINKLFDIDNDTYNKGNTTIITSDAVVKYRSIINGVPVIFSEKDKTTYICPGDPTMINRAFISTIARELYAHNASIIKVIDEVIKAKPTIRDEWLGNTWNNSEHINTAISILEHYRNRLIIMHDITKRELPSLQSVEAAKDYISAHHFNCPFIIKKTGIKIVRTFVSFLTGNPDFNFKAEKFTETLVQTKSNHIKFFPSYAQAKAQSGGGDIIQNGGFFGLIYLKTIVSGVLIQALGVSAEEVVKRTVLSNPYVAMGVGAAAAGAAGLGLAATYMRSSPSPEYYKELSVDDRAIDETNDIAFVILDKMIGKCNIDTTQACLDQGELYCYIKEYFPEIFTYAIKLATATPPASRTAEDTYIINPDFLTRYDPDAGMKSYYWNETNAFVSYIAVTEAAQFHNKQAARAILLAEALINYYPGLQRMRLNRAITKLKGMFLRFYHSILYAPISDNLNRALIRGMSGGHSPNENELKDNTDYSDEQKIDLDIAMELYELHYSRLIKSAYTDIHTDKMIGDRLNIILAYDTSIPEEYSKDENYKYMKSRTFELIMEEYSSLPIVRQYTEYISEDFDRVIRDYMKAHRKIETLTPLEVITKMLENNPELKANAPQPIHQAVLATGSANHEGGSRFRNLKYTRKTRRKQRKARTTRIRRSKRDNKK